MRQLTALLILALPLQGTKSLAQELEPRSYTNIPVNMNFMAVGYARSAGSVLVDPAVELENADVTIHGPLIGYARSVRVGPRSGKFDLGIGNVCLDGSADADGHRVSRYVCGWTDARIRFAVNLMGAPALAMENFAHYRQDLIVGASVSASVPLGNYNPDRLVNIGTNRWSGKVELGASKALHRWLFELSVSTTLFESNDDFFGGRLRKQDPITALQVHVVRRFESGVWLAIDSTWYGGGETQTDGLDNANFQSNTRFGMTLSVPVNRHHSLKLNASTGVLTRTGSDFDTAGLMWQYRWGSME